MDEKQLIENDLLEYLNTCIVENSLDYAKLKNIDHGVLIGVIKSLHTEFYLTTEEITVSSWKLSEEAERYISEGTPEIQLLNKISKEGMKWNEVTEKLPVETVKIAQGICMKNKWIRLDKKENMVYRMVDQVTDTTRDLLEILQKHQGELTSISNTDAQNLKKRKLIALQTTKSYKVMKGPKYAVQRKKQHASITKEMIESGSWNTEVFKGYNFNSLGAPVGGGCLHPLQKVRTEFRQVLMNMGFQEMPTNRFVESSFWNFDALFQPQSHPARDAHDTFFLTTPKHCNTIPEEYYEKVRTMHEFGGNGSIGHGRGAFTREESTKNLLRTHTTAVSAQMLYRLANSEGGFKPSKFFSIDRVFRNETMDATHLAEFHQVEGLVADYDLSIGDLIGVINDFFSKIGITNIRFKPAYNPYTEPSMEIFAFHPDLKKWTEVGNSGIFRPEMLLPMGLPPNVRVIAWGLSLERPTMIKYRIKNIRDLFGHKIDLEKSRSAKLFRV